MNKKTENALERVQKFLTARGYTVARATMPVPDGTRDMLLVDEETVVVHPRDKPALYRLRNELRHGIRERALEYYAQRDWMVIIYEEDTGTVLLAEAKALFGGSQPWVIAGAVEGPNERIRYFARSAFTVLAAGV